MSIQGRLEVASDLSYPDRNRPPVHTSQVELGCPQNWKSGNKILSEFWAQAENLKFLKMPF